MRCGGSRPRFQGGEVYPFRRALPSLRRRMTTRRDPHHYIKVRWEFMVREQARPDDGASPGARDAGSLPDFGQSEIVLDSLLIATRGGGGVGSGTGTRQAVGPGIEFEGSIRQSGGTERGDDQNQSEDKAFHSVLNSIWDGDQRSRNKVYRDKAAIGTFSVEIFCTRNGKRTGAGRGRSGIAGELTPESVCDIVGKGEAKRGIPLRSGFGG